MLTFTEAQAMAWISPILWPFLRILAVFTTAPVLSSRAIPVRARIGLAFLIAFAAQPSLQGQAVISLDAAEALGAVLQQLGIGFAIGFAVRILFAAVELAGAAVGFQMGLGFAAFFDPSINPQSSAVARFFGHMAALLVIVLNGHLLVLMAVQKSFDAFPVSATPYLAVGTMKLHELGTDLFASAMWIALPLIGMLMFVNLALGFVSRVAPQMNIYAIGFPVTLSAGLIGLAATLPVLDRPFIAMMERVIDLVSR